jgi:hypothetical protein
LSIQLSIALANTYELKLLSTVVTWVWVVVVGIIGVDNDDEDEDDDDRASSVIWPARRSKDCASSLIASSEGNITTSCSSLSMSVGSITVVKLARRICICLLSRRIRDVVMSE